MSATTASWPCPACGEVIPATFQDCPYCGALADWLDLMRAVDFAVRRFLLWKLEGALSAAQYRAVVEACRRQLDQLARGAATGRPAPADTGLPPRCQCWSCRQTNHPGARYCAGCGAPLDTPEARLIRYQTFLACEVKRQEEAGRLTAAQSAQLMSDAPQRLAELRERLEKDRLPARV
jgi:hypothetical protein